MRTFIDGWRLILAVLWSLIKRVLEIIEFFLEVGRGKRRSGRVVDCFNRPDLRARPDPYIYSQSWLYARGLAFTWDNPDFALIDPSDNLAKDPHQLKPHKLYKVRATIHNSSIMDAVHTTVAFDVLHFGAGTAVVQVLGSIIVDVPALGSTVAEIDWITPANAGHNCLRALIQHPDDANPLNNLGQHNTDVASPASPTRKLTFHVANQSENEQRFTLEMNAYRLPPQPLRPTVPRHDGEKYAEAMPRSSLAYLRRLQEINDFRKFPVPKDLEAKLQHTELVLKPGEEVETSLLVKPPMAGAGRRHVNINVMLDRMLIGGVTAYVEEA